MSGDEFVNQILQWIKEGTAHAGTVSLEDGNWTLEIVGHQSEHVTWLMKHKHPDLLSLHLEHEVTHGVPFKTGVVYKVKQYTATIGGGSAMSIKSGMWTVAMEAASEALLKMGDTIADAFKKGFSLKDEPPVIASAEGAYLIKTIREALDDLNLEMQEKNLRLQMDSLVVDIKEVGNMAWSVTICGNLFEGEGIPVRQFLRAGIAVDDWQAIAKAETSPVLSLTYLVIEGKQETWSREIPEFPSVDNYRLAIVSDLYRLYT